MVEEKDITSLFSSAFLMFFSTILGSGSKLFERMVIGKILSPSAYGTVTIGISILMVGSTIGMMGLHRGVARFVSRSTTEEESRGFWLASLITSISFATVISILLFSQSLFSFNHYFDTDTVNIVQVFLIAIPFFVGMRVTISSIQGFENTIYRNLAFDIIYPITRIGAMGFFFWLGFKELSAGIAYVLATFVGFVVSLYLLNKLIKLRGKFTMQYKQLILFSAPLMVASMTSLLLTRTDTIMIGILRNTTEVGMYEAAFPLANTLVLVLSSFGFIYLPMASRLDSDGKIDEVNSVYKLTTKWVFIITFPLFATLIIFPIEILRIFFSSSYMQASTTLIILSFGFFTNAILGRNRETLTALGHSNYVMYINIGAFILNLILNLYLIPRYGFNGAALASAISFIIMNIIAVLCLQFLYSINPFSVSSIRTFIILPIVFLPLIYSLSKFMNPSIISLAVLESVFYICVLGTVGLTGCLQEEDQVLFDQIREKIDLPFNISW